MATTIHAPGTDQISVATPTLRISLGNHRLLAAVAIFAMVIGGGSLLGGVFGAAYTWNQAAVQDITTPDDARFAEVPVRGPLSMWAQSDIITHHQLDTTEGLYYAQMERMVPAVDEDGNAILDESGEQLMVPNEARASWISATSLTTALGLGILSYAVSAFAIVVGLVLLAMGWVVLRLRRATVALT